MVAKSRLLGALAREKGTDYDKLKQKKKHKAALKEKQRKSAPTEDEEEKVFDIEAEVSGDDDDDDDDEDEEESDAEETAKGAISLGNLQDDESSSESEIGGNDEEEDGIDLEDIEGELDEDDDILPYQRTTINNTTALLASLKRIAIPTSKKVPFATHQMLVAEEVTETKIPDVSDDTNREVQFLAQALDCARKGRALLRKEGVPFSRPTDYFAEMLKPEEQMEKVKSKLVEEASAKKASAEARKQRDLKKFGKQVQVAKQQERAKQKRETLDKIKSLKRKRADGSSGELGVREAEDMFDVVVDNELERPDQKRGGAAGAVGGKKRPAAQRGGPGKRQRKDEKYGFGGKKRHAKSGDAISSGDLSGFSTKRMKGKGKAGAGKAPRPGKGRRVAAAARR